MRINVLSITKKISQLLNRRQKKQSIALLGLFVVMSMFQVVGVAAIFPFVNLVMDPTLVETNTMLHTLYEMFSFSSSQSFVTAIGLAVFVLIVVSNAISALTLWAKTKFVMGLNHTLSTKLLSHYLSKSYTFFLNRNTSEMSKNLIAEVFQLTNNLLIPLFDLVANSFMVLLLVALLLSTEFVPTLLAMLVIGGSYALITYRVKKKVKNAGIVRLDANKERYKVTNEALSGIKATKLFGREQYFIDKFSNSSQRFTSMETYVRTTSELPRYFLEALAFGGIILLVVILNLVQENTSEIIPLVSLFAFAGYRLLPSLQKIFNSLTSIYFNQAILDALHADLTDASDMENLQKEVKKLSFSQKIVLDHVTFFYPKSGIPTIRDISLTIPKQSSIGFVGTTGSGKTTLVDILMGLLIPQEGTMYIDGVVLDSQNCRSWQRNIAYVPQDIFLSDDTIGKNIAFGIPDDCIDHAQVRHASQLASLDVFIEQDLVHGYDTMIGERGVRLSGGQRQRIGLARALYRNPDVLVLDEATSSLDGETETSVLSSIKQASGDRTLITIAHRLSTVRDCDVIYMVDDGRIVDFGTYDSLLSTNRHFMKMAKLL